MSKIKKIIIMLLAVLAIVSIAQGCRNAAEYSQDFQWDAAKVLSLGMNPYDESINPSEQLLSLGYEEYYKQMEANQFPSLLFLLYPYLIFKPLAARYAWIVSNLIFTALLIWVLRLTLFKECHRDDYIILSLLMLAGTPWRNHMGVGQHTIFALLFFLLSVYVMEYSRIKDKKYSFIVTGLLLCVSYFKYTLTVPLGLYYVYKRRWKELIVSVVPHIVLTMVAAVYLNDSFINMIIKPLKVASVLTSEGSMDIGSMLGGGSFTMLISVAIMVLLLVIVFRAESGFDKQIISMLALWSLVITYHRSYDFFAMILIFAAFVPFGAKYDKKESKLMLAGAIALTLLVFFGLRFFHESRLSLQLTAVLSYIYTLAFTYLILKDAGIKRSK